MLVLVLALVLVIGFVIGFGFVRRETLERVDHRNRNYESADR